MENNPFLGEKVPEKHNVEAQKKVPEKDKSKDAQKREDVPMCWKVLVVVLSVLTIILLVTLLVLAVRWRNLRTDALKKREQRVCVHQTRLHSCTGELEQQNETLCCGLTSHIVSALADQYVQMKFEDTAGTRMLSEKCGNGNETVTQHSQIKHVAKLSGLDMDRIRQQGEGTLVFWNDKTPSTILHGLNYQSGCLKIQGTGFYFVHSQIKLSKNTQSTASSADDVSSHDPYYSLSMYRNRKRDDNIMERERLLESSNSACDITSEDNEMTISIGAVFEFQNGDTVSVETSHPQNLAGSTESNYFGLYAI